MIRDRYFWLVLMVGGLMTFCATTGTWGGDFWSHAAAVREVSLRPFHPRHPEVAADLPGLFFTPYAVAVGWLARVAGISPITALAAAGLCNLVLVFGALRVYLHDLLAAPTPSLSIRHVQPAVDAATAITTASRYSSLVAFYTVLFVLLLWGPSPWQWSGFFHLQVLPAVISYPSTFATALSLWALTRHLRWLRDRSRTPWSLCAISALILLTHPMTAVAYGVGLVAQTLGIRGERSWKEHVVVFGAVAVVGASAGVLWPYYPFFGAIGKSAEYHEANADMYVDVWRPIWPVVLALPCLAWRVRRNARDPVALGFLGLTGLYLYGGITGAFAYGRVLSHAVMTAHLTLAAWVAENEIRHTTGRPLAPMRVAGLMAITAVLVFSVYLNLGGIQASIADRSDIARSYQFLQRYVGPDEVVLSDLANSYPVPAFAGKVVSHVGVLTLVPDALERTSAVERFFDDAATIAERLEIIHRYDVRWLLLDRTQADSTRIAQLLAPPAGPVFMDDHWILIELHRRRPDLAAQGVTHSMER